MTSLMDRSLFKRNYLACLPLLAVFVLGQGVMLVTPSNVDAGKAKVANRPSDDRDDDEEEEDDDRDDDDSDDDDDDLKEALKAPPPFRQGFSSRSKPLVDRMSREEVRGWLKEGKLVQSGKFSTGEEAKRDIARLLREAAITHYGWERDSWLSRSIPLLTPEQLTQKRIANFPRKKTSDVQVGEFREQVIEFTAEIPDMKKLLRAYRPMGHLLPFHHLMPHQQTALSRVAGVGIVSLILWIGYWRVNRRVLQLEKNKTG